MSLQNPPPKRYIGLDIHKHYLIAIGVDADLNQVFGPQRVQMSRLAAWIHKTIMPFDAVVLEMTTNTWEVHDSLLPYAHSVTIVHPPHVSLITRAQVMTDKIAAATLARLHAKGLLVGLWVPPQDVRDRRALIAQRSKMTRLSTQAKNRLHAVLHRHHLSLPAGDPFLESQHAWWLSLPLNPLEMMRVQSDLNTLIFARSQIDLLDNTLTQIAAIDDRIMLLVQLPGISILSALTILAAIGRIDRFPSAKQLVGYAGLGARIHDSGQSTRTGRITKAGRKDLRTALVEAAHTAANTHPHWQSELARLEPRIGHNKAIVAIARKLLVAVWYILSKGEVDRHAEPERLARKFLQTALNLGKANRQPGVSPGAFTRHHLDRLDFAHEVTQVTWGKKRRPIPLPPSAQPD